MKFRELCRPENSTWAKFENYSKKTRIQNARPENNKPYIRNFQHFKFLSEIRVNKQTLREWKLMKLEFNDCSSLSL